MSETEHDVEVLNELIETTIDSANGYGEAAKEVDNTRFASTFASRAQERAQVTTQLQQQVRTLGGEPDDEGTVLAKAHRMFVNLRKSLHASDKAVVDEVERGEDHIKAKFEKALKDGELSPPTRSVIMQAYVSVKTGHDQMRDLKRALHHNA